jgi:hypothetical protein
MKKKNQLGLATALDNIRLRDVILGAERFGRNLTGANQSRHLALRPIGLVR